MPTPEQAALSRAAAELAGAEMHALADDVRRALARLTALERVAAAAWETFTEYSDACWHEPLRVALAQLSGEAARD
jgi:hypothetical protein